MNEQLPNLIEALRQELTQYGEMLALLDAQQDHVMHRRTPDLLQNVAEVNGQVENIHAARREREQYQRNVARQLALAEEAAFTEIVPRLPADYRPLVQALVDENNALLVRVQQRARQNHILLSRAVELMQRFLGTLFPGAAQTTYDGAGRTQGAVVPQHSLYETIG